VVTAEKDSKESSRLIAYYSTTTKQSIPKEELISHLNNYLPDYMIPTVYIHLDKFPLTANGKIDRKNLPVYNFCPEEKEQAESPLNELEQEVRTIWENVLEISPINLHDDFLELGGQSILAMRIVNEINTNFDTNLSIIDIFTDGYTVYKLSKIIETALINQVSQNELKTILNELE
jgi:hypothetical protein